MIFSSLEFIFIFLPIFLILYSISPTKCRNYILLIGSILFYVIGCWEHPHYIFLILLAVLVNYHLGKTLEKNKNRKVLITGIIYHLMWLILFKYSDFMISILSTTSKTPIPTLNLSLPIGISFYTFQSISYLVDIYKGRYVAEKSILQYAMYVFMFPQLISGPIVTYDTIKKQLKRRTFNSENMTLGFKYFIVGLGFKVLLANRIRLLME